MSRQLKTVRQFSDDNPAFSEASLRWQISKAKENGLADAGVILRNGRRVLIDSDRFHKWLEARQRVAA